MTKTLCRGKGRRGIPAGSRPYHLLISYVSLNFSFAASDDTIIPLKPIDLMVERRTIQSCLTILFSSPSAKYYQPWDSYIFPPEVVELVFLDVKACAGDVQAATSLNAKTDLALSFAFASAGGWWIAVPAGPGISSHREVRASAIAGSF